MDMQDDTDAASVDSEGLLSDDAVTDAATDAGGGGLDLAHLSTQVQSALEALARTRDTVAAERAEVARGRERLARARREVEEAQAEVASCRVRAEDQYRRELQELARFSISDIVDLDVGGTRMRTYRSTLRSAGGLLEAMFSGRHDPVLTADGAHFIDCDAQIFRRMLNAVRFGTLDEDVDTCDALHRLAEYFQIHTIPSSRVFTM